MGELTNINASGASINRSGRNDLGANQPFPVDSDHTIETDILIESKIVIDTEPKNGFAKEERNGSKLWTRKGGGGATGQIHCKTN